jgi:hypothetical protein
VHKNHAALCWLSTSENGLRNKLESSTYFAQKKVSPKDVVFGDVVTGVVELTCLQFGTWQHSLTKRQERPETMAKWYQFSVTNLHENRPIFFPVLK